MTVACARIGTLAALALIACSPALDWREVRPAGGELVAMFPCKPKAHARPVALAGARVRMHLTACSAENTTYALAYASMDDPAKVTGALDELRRSAAANIGAAATPGAAWRVPGMTPNPRAEKLLLEGRGADGQPVREQVVFFVKGLRVYQATIVGERIDPEAAETFFGGIKFDT
jgi:hypothetical protein